MNRTTGTGLIGVGAVLAVAGAIMKYAVEVTASQSGNFNVNTAGQILLIAGIALFVVGLVFVVMTYSQGRRRELTREEIRTTPETREYVERRDEYR